MNSPAPCFTPGLCEPGITCVRNYLWHSALHNRKTGRVTSSSVKRSGILGTCPANVQLLNIWFLRRLWFHACNHAAMRIAPISLGIACLLPIPGWHDLPRPLYRLQNRIQNRKIQRKCPNSPKPLFWRLPARIHLGSSPVSPASLPRKARSSTSWSSSAIRKATAFSCAWNSMRAAPYARRSSLPLNSPALPINSQCNGNFTTFTGSQKCCWWCQSLATAWTICCTGLLRTMCISKSRLLFPTTKTCAASSNGTVFRITICR